MNEYMWLSLCAGGIGVLAHLLERRGQRWARPVRIAGGLIVIVTLLFELVGCAATPPVVAQAPTPAPITIPDDPYSKLSPEVVAAIRQGQTNSLKEGITTLYNYSPDRQWTINCQPFEATEIRLSSDETTDDNDVILGDPDRWDVKVGEHVVLVKAKASDKYIDPKTGKPVPGDYDVRGNVVIHTTKGRIYHVQLKLRRPATPVIGWFYPQDVKDEEAARQAAIKQAQAQGQLASYPVPTAIVSPAAPQEVSKR